MGAFPTGAVVPRALAPSVASPSARERRGATPSPGRAASSPETPPEVGAGVSGRVVLPSFRPSDEAMAAYVALWQRLRIARDRGKEVPCLGPGSEAWTSDHRDEQQLAARACADCPALALCRHYADLAAEPVGTWGGVTRGRGRPARTVPSQGRHCACGCDGVTKGGRYQPGHDARHLAQLVRFARAGAISREGAYRALAGSPRLQAKFAQCLRG